ncbi:MAG: hypothetical protein UU67_C0016G0018 [Candidatus Daviesbacteria bacterium GW2011_GWB1_41_5]|uniref:Uncharacterized protein n=1 Tax=Candidatus Daviesbacteria bacterium GW2011_GWB1_41_5 TaxID=1618429 RepID=A0A0G0WLY2_9BACT|nr:MAG: hypothetical protein UU67_C0016G0018 [Candidatus Daviesbacteria bacterium GW2011_GWB1_41_5]
MEAKKKTQGLKIDKTINKTASILLGFKNFKILHALAAVFFVIWIFIGIFVLLLLADGFKRGAYQGLFGKQSQPQQTQVPQPPTDVDLPGIGKVDVECAQSALADESIQKIVTEESTKSLTDDEKASFEKCIVEPAPSPTPTS